MSLLDAAKARKELQATDMATIERNTALTWGGRAVASYGLSQDAKGLQKRIKHFYEAENYRQEALEHAAMAEDDCKLLQAIHDEIDAARKAALKDLKASGAAA